MSSSYFDTILESLFFSQFFCNLNHLYLTSLGFCVILAAGAIGTSGLLIRRKWRRFIPFLFPLFFVLISLVLTTKFDERNKYRAQMPEVAAIRGDLKELTQGTGSEGQRP